jgi:transcriptional regulator with XRE-family HTH domain
MLTALVNTLSAEQREKLLAFGITKQLLSAWKLGKRLPTEVQVVALAEICGVDRYELQDEVTLLRASPEQRKLLERLMGKARGVVAMLVCGVAVAVAFAAGYSAGGPRGLFARR